MPLIVAIVLQIIGVAGGATALGFWLDPWAALVPVSGAVFYVGLEMERRG